jgi:hypothetical protein
MKGEGSVGTLVQHLNKEDTVLDFDLIVTRVSLPNVIMRLNPRLHGCTVLLTTIQLKALNPSRLSSGFSFFFSVQNCSLPRTTNL